MSGYQRLILLMALLLIDLAALAGAIAIHPAGHVVIIAGLAALSLGAAYEGARSLYRLRVHGTSAGSTGAASRLLLRAGTARRLVAVIACAVVTCLLVWSFGPVSWTTTIASVAAGMAVALVGLSSA